MDLNRQKRDNRGDLFVDVVDSMVAVDDFTIGDTVRITGTVMPGSVGTVVHLDRKRDMYLVRVGVAQNYYRADELEKFSG